jgi:hypothetical protein
MTTEKTKRLLPEVEKMLSAASARKIEGAEVGKGRPQAYRRGRRGVVILLASLALTGTALAVVTGWTGWTPLSNEAIYRSTRHTCGSFRTKSQDGTTPYVIVVTHSPSVPCGAATAVIKAFWTDGETVHHGGQIVANSYYTLKSRPGWRCVEAAGSGLCNSRGGEIANYEVRIPGQTSARTDIVSPKGVGYFAIGFVRIGATVQELHELHAIGRVGPSCEFDRSRGAPLRAPLHGFAIFDYPGTRLSTLEITGGVETEPAIRIGSTAAEARRAYPRATYDAPGSLEPFAEGFLWIGGREHPKLTLVVDPKTHRISEIDVPAPSLCE